MKYGVMCPFLDCSIIYYNPKNGQVTFCVLYVYSFTFYVLHFSD